jgi:hypothetical protein
MMKITRLALAFSFLPLLSLSSLAQKQKPAPVCSQSGLAAFRKLPKLEYECPEPETSDEALLKLPERLTAIRKLERALATFTTAAWWNANADDLNVCEITGRAGKMTDAEKQKLTDSEYDLKVFGNHQMRLIVLADPCYATGYSGSNAFLLVRNEGKVFVSQVLDGYASRVGNSVGVDFANLNGQTLVEVSTANSFPPSLDNFYFVVDSKTNHPVPKKLFKVDNKMRNEIDSDMLMGEPKDFGLPNNATELNIIRNGRLMPSFSAYELDEHGKIDGRLRRVIYRWNGRFYSPGR